MACPPPHDVLPLWIDVLSRGAFVHSLADVVLRPRKDVLFPRDVVLPPQYQLP